MITLEEIQAKQNELAAMIEKHPEESPWRPIETAPKDGSLIVAKGNNYGNPELGYHVRVAAWDQGCWMEEASVCSQAKELKYLTHWMPLPPAPK